MAREDETPLDRLTDKHELGPYDPDDAGRTEVVAVEHGGRRLEVIVPLLYDGLRVGEVVAAAVAGETVFLLGRYDRQLSADLGTPGLLVVAVPYRDGRHRAVIAHATYSLDGDGHLAGLGLHPAPGTRAGAGTDTGSTGQAPGQPAVMEEARALQRAVPFRPFLILTASGERYPVYGADYAMIDPAGGFLMATGPVYKMAMVDAAEIAAVRAIGSDDPEAIGPVSPAGDEAEDGRGIQEDFGRLRARLDGVEGATRRVDLDLRREAQKVNLDLRGEIQKVALDLRGVIQKVALDLRGVIQKVALDFRREAQKVALDLGSAIQQGDTDIRGEFQRAQRDHTAELSSLRISSDFHRWILVALVIIMFAALWWSGTTDSRVHVHDLDLKRIEADLIKRREAVDLRLDELQAAVRQAQERAASAR